MGGLPDIHPFSIFNKYFYMESGTANMPIYLWKKDNKGLLVELYLNDKESGPRGRVYELLFSDEYNFDLNKQLRNVVGYNNLDDLYSAMVRCIQEELNKL